MIRTSLAALTLVAFGATAGLAASNEVNLYSYRQPFLINPMLDAFTKETGIKVNVVYAKSGVLEKLKAEGANSPADVILTVDVARLNDIAAAGLLQPVKSATLEKNIPAHYREPNGLWFGLTTRARVIFVSKARVKEGQIKSYEDLTDPKWKGRICTRSGKHPYNISLIASVIAHKGEKGAETWLKGLSANLARKPQGNDRAQAKAILEGVCDAALANTYYMGAMATNDKQPEQKTWADAVRIVFPNQGDRGTHVNISGAAVTKSAKNRDNAIKLLEFLSGDTAQKLYAAKNFEYPVKVGVEWDPVVASWGRFEADKLNLTDVAKHRADASILVDKTGFDQSIGGS
ncbi:MAG: iron ABC transporter substrate-binding protein [Rhodospirillales bacterium RIFCSPLOWO2_01_FULL_65_14]|nr:MAG: iron ABC transporter substrate-binding protein [Rhodospirillales bacterium RIFCSPLOWO2_01_FULL_65_14]